jgi:spermidine synthase
VFVAGGVLMGLEIAGSRVLAPHFGNSVFIWGSLISVFLASLAIGYYGGGRLADRYPSLVLLTTVTVVVSIWILLLGSFAPVVCDRLVEAGFGERSGSLVASLILFLPPSVGLGILSPFAVRIAATSVLSVGKVAGGLYALSTAGSIAGTLITTFMLIPWLGLSVILKVLGLVLLATSIITLFTQRKAAQHAIAASIVGVLAVVLAANTEPPSPLGRYDVLRYETDTPYHHIAVVDNTNYDSRQMLFDRYTESAVTLEPPHQTLAEYTNYFQLAFLPSPDMHRVLFIGAGGGVGPRAYFAHQPSLEIDLVDIDPRVLDVAHEFFFLDRRPNLRSIAADGRMFLRGANGGYDCIILDAFTIGGRIPFHLVTREFLELCSAKSTADGLFVMNINSSLEGEKSGIYQSMHATLSEVYPQVYVFALDRGRRRTHESTNVILVASKRAERLTPEDWKRLASEFRTDAWVNAEMVEAMAANLVTKPTPTDRAVIFTDNFCPIETMEF